MGQILQLALLHCACDKDVLQRSPYHAQNSRGSHLHCYTTWNSVAYSRL